MSGRVIRTSEGESSAAFGPVEWGLMLATAGMWGSSFVFIASALDTLSPPVISLGRVILGALAVALVPRARRPVDRSDLPTIAVLGVIWVGIPFLLFPIAQQWVDSSVAGLINGSMPIFAGTIAAVLLRRRPGPAQTIGLIVGFAGVVVVTVQSIGGEAQGAIGVGLLLLATACYGLAVNLTVPLTQRYGSLPVILRAQLFALIVIAPFGIWGLGSSTFTWPGLGAVAFLGVLGSGVALVFMGELGRRVGATRASVTIYLVPVVAVVLGAAVRSEVIAPLTVAGGALVLIGAWLTSRAERPQVTGPGGRR